MKKDSKEIPFVFYPSFRDQLKAIKNNDVRLSIFDALADYGVCGIEPDFTEIDPLGTIEALFVPMRQDIDKAKARYFACVENGKKGGAPKGNKNARKQPNSTQDNQKQPDSTQNNLDIDKDIDKDIDINAIKNSYLNISNQRLECKNTPCVLPAFAQKDYVFVQNLWNDVCTNFSKVAKLTSKNSGGKRSNRKGAIKSCMNFLAKNFTENHTLDEANGKLGEVFEKVNKSSFLKGDNEKAWRADFDWVMREDHLIRIIEGSYDNGGPAAQKSGNVNDIWK